MSHYECIALCKHVSLQWGQFCARISSLVYPKIQRRQVIMNVLHPSCAWPPWWSPPVLWRRFEDGLASVCDLIHSYKMLEKSETMGLNDGWKWWQEWLHKYPATLLLLFSGIAVLLRVTWLLPTFWSCSTHFVHIMYTYQCVPRCDVFTSDGKIANQDQILFAESHIFWHQIWTLIYEIPIPDLRKSPSYNSLNTQI